MTMVENKGGEAALNDIYHMRRGKPYGALLR